jgi:hypothetical protein
MGTKEKQTIAGYFGLAVEVLCRMASCSLIRYRERVFIVETLDLDSCWRLGWGGGFGRAFHPGEQSRN